MFFSRLLTILTLLLWTSQIVTLSAQTVTEKIDDLINYYVERDVLNGNILIASKGEIIYSRSNGFAHIKDQKPLNINTPFCIASVTKQFTAMGIMLLNHQQKLEYSNTIKDYFPEFPKYMHEITIKNLLQHTSGLRRTHFPYEADVTNEDAYKGISETKHTELLFKPGADIKYCNTAYVMLALIIEKVSGQSYEKFLNENIFAPLGMTHTFVLTEDDLTRDDLAVGFNGFGNEDDYNMLTYGSAGIYSTVEDLFRWTQSFGTNKLMPKEKKLIAYEAAESIEGKELSTKVGEEKRHYGFGLVVYKDILDGSVGHGGAFGGFYNHIIKDLINDFDVITLTNNGRNLRPSVLNSAIIHILRGEEFEYPKISIDAAIREQCRKNVEEGITLYQKLKSESQDKFVFDDEQQLNNIGYALLDDNQIDEAIKIFKLLISEFPDKSNPYDSLGEAYYNKKKYKLAIQNYEKSIELDKGNSNAEVMIMKIKELVDKK